MKKQIIIVFLMLTVMACKNAEKKPENHAKQTANEAVKKTEDKEHDFQNLDLITLNNGKKWTANPETTQGIATMQEILNDFQADSDLIAYEQLKTRLENQFTLIFQRCTMKGEAHEQLHNYLKPMIEWFDGLVVLQNDERIKNLNMLKKHLLSYKNYFN